MVQQQDQGQAAGVVSLALDDMVEGGGPPIQQNLTIKDAVFGYFDYGGKAPQVTALKVEFVTDSGEVLTAQHYSVGDPTRFQPSADGQHLIPVGGAAGVNKTSNFGVLLVELANVGFPIDRLTAEGIGLLKGFYAYWDGKTVPGRTGLGQQTAGGQNRQPVVCVPTVLHRLPWDAATAEAGNPAASPAAPGTPPTPPAPAVPLAVPPPQVDAAAQQQQAAAGQDPNVGHLKAIVDSLPQSFGLNDIQREIYSRHGNDSFRDSLSMMASNPATVGPALNQLGYSLNGMTVTRN